MIRMKAEAVVITKPDVNTNLNGANINMNGKVLLSDAADKGYKGAGTLTGDIVLCVASGDRETKVAETAMNVLTAHIPALKAAGDSFAAEADTFFNHAYRELSLQSGAYSTFSATLLYNHADRVYIANTGDNAVYTFDGMYLDQIEFESDEPKKKEDELPTADINCKVISAVKPGTQIIVLSKEIYEYTTDEQILDILRNAVSVKQACQKLIDQATENGAESYTAVMIENLTPIDVPVASAPDAVAANAEGNEEEPEEDLTKPSKAPLVVLILLLIIVALVAGVYFANQKYDFIDKIAQGRTTTQEEVTEPSANIVTLPSASATVTAATSATTTTDVSTTATSTTRGYDPDDTTRRATSTTRRTTTTEAPTSSTPAPTDEPTEEPVSETQSNEEPSSQEAENPSDENENDAPVVTPPDDDELA